MSGFICPVCKDKLLEEGKTLRCSKGHSFDRARSGYVNLLLSNKGNHGDDSSMVKARKAFLDGGYYKPLEEMLSDVTERFCKDGGVIVDAGCGECRYTAAVWNRLNNKVKDSKIYGIDVSKYATDIGAKRCKGLRLAVASVSEMPFENAFADILMSVFSPFCTEEFARVLKADGIVLRAFPLERHLFGLKSIIYKEPYENTVENNAPDGFELLERKEYRGEILVEGEEKIRSLFMMTPYFHRTSREDSKKLLGLKSLKTEIEFGLDIYKKSISDGE